LTRSKAFRALVDKAYAVCDSDKAGKITKTELYAGLLLVHLNLAKYAGPAACYPPTRKVCDQLFEAADADRSGTIDKDEFVKIMGITCAQITGRILIYYLVLIMLVPTIATIVVDYLEITNDSFQERAAEQSIGIAFFFLVIPMGWNYIDTVSEKELEKHAHSPKKKDASASKME